MPTFVVCSPTHVCDLRMVVAAMRAGELGLFDLGYAGDIERHRPALRRLAEQTGRYEGTWGGRWDVLGREDRSPRRLAGLIEQRWPYLVLAGLPHDAQALRTALAEAREFADRVWLEVYGVEQAQLAQEAGFDGLIVAGHEAGGFVSADSSYLLLQQLAGKVTIPYWLRGGIGPDTAAAALVGGAAGVVLGEQLWLTAEGPFSSSERAAWRNFDGSETAAIEVGGRYFRFLCRTDRSTLQAFETAAASGEDVAAAIAARLTSDDPAIRASLVPLGQEIALAARSAGRGLTIADVLSQMRQQIETNLRIAREKHPLSVGGPLAAQLGTKYPILQGPMTRVSDTAEFCSAVAENGALPFLALAVMAGGESRTLLQETKQKLGDRPWGVGVLGFIPGEMRDAQDAAIAETLPPYAIIAGGRPSQAARFEKLGISTFLHVPSPGLLETFIVDGARKFIFEGRECGGHVGPRPSFILWQQQIQVLLDAKVADPASFQIVFAGGVHDGLSAAMVSALAARLVERGMNVGVLIGTGYLFTQEAVDCGAITAEFQRQAVACRETVLLESGVGHATRCARTPFADDFNAHKNELIRAGKTADEIRLELELFNIGRLRIASKGQVRQSDPAAGSKGSLVTVDADEQRRTGMYMIGQVAALRDRVVSMAELHADLVAGCQRRLTEVTVESPTQLPSSHTEKVAAKPDEPIAIVGMAGMFPKAGDIRRFWENIFNRIDAVGEVPDGRWSADVNFHEDRLARDTVYSKWGGFLDEARFNPFQWRIPPATLSSIEPVQLMSLEVAWAAFRDAGYDHRPFPRERTSVIFGIAGPHDVGLEYSFRTMAPHYLSQMPGLSQETVDKVLQAIRSETVEWTEDSFPGFLSNVVAGRIANRLDLGGTNFVVDAACAASLAALHTGIAQLRMGWSDVVLLGTADASNNLFTFQCFSKTHALSPRGRSRPFDDSADGIAIGEAIAALVLKRLSDAERDGDQIYAVIRGIGSSSDGNNRSLTAPHPPAQVQAIRRAYADAQVDPGTVSLIEAHGTGTAVGDRSEIQSLVDGFSASAKQRQATAVGSIKSMIGHTKTAAGVVGVVKTALALRHRVLPPTIGVETPNKQVDFSHSPFYVNTEVRPWFQELGDVPRRAGVSAFGFGGTNFHVVLEEYEQLPSPTAIHDFSPRPVEVFCWRRATREQLLADLAALQKQFAAGVPENLAAFGAACWAAERRRPVASNACRLAIVASSGADLAAKLAKAVEKLAAVATFSDPTGIYFSAAAPCEASSVCFLYPGQGSQAVGMLRDIVAVSPWSLDLFARWNRLLSGHLPEPLTRYIYPPPAFSNDELDAQRRALTDTRVAQPALGAVELFSTQLLERFNVRPAMTAGHSYGEYVALYAAGCIAADDLLAVSAVRGRVSAEAVSTSPGAMAAVQIGADALQPILDELRLDVVIANRNSPQQVVVAGTATAVDIAVKQLKERGLRAVRLAVSAPFHTPALATAAGALGTQLSMLNFREPQCAVYANTTADRYPTDPAAIRALLQRHLIEPVSFDRQIERMHADGARLFLEVGPGRALSGLVDQILHDRPHTTLTLDAAGRDGVTQLGHLLAATVAHGVPTQFDAWYAGRTAEDRSPQEVLRAEAEARQIKPTDWYINSSGMRPAAAPAAPKAPPATAAKTDPTPTVATSAPAPTAAPTVAPTPAVAAGTRKVAQSASQSSTAAASPAAAASPVTNTTFATTSSPRLPAMNSPVPAQDMNHSVQPVEYVSPVPSSTVADAQTLMSQWIALQHSQQQVNDRFLRLQERMLFGNVDGAPLPTLAAPQPRALIAAPPAPAAAPAPLSAAPVTPVSAAHAVHTNGSIARPTSLTPARGAITLPARAMEQPPETPRLRDAAGSVARPVVASAPAVAVSAPRVESNGHAAHASATPAAHAPAAADSSGPPSTEQFTDDLLRVISERTGYPIDMLDKDLPLEAGLGIDSIKTVEVFSKLKIYHPYFQRPDQDEEEVLKVFTRLKTLRDIINLYDELRAHHLAPAPSNGAVEAKAKSATPQANGSSVKRFELQPVEAVADGDEKKNHLSTTS